jgi:hypothetical protein
MSDTAIRPSTHSFQESNRSYCKCDQESGPVFDSSTPVDCRRTVACLARRCGCCGRGLAKVTPRVCVNVWILFERFGIRALVNGPACSQPARGKCGRSVRHYSSEASDYVVLVHRVKSGNRVRPLQVSRSSPPFRPDIRVYLRARISVHVLSSQGGVLPSE